MVLILKMQSCRFKVFYRQFKKMFPTARTFSQNSLHRGQRSTAPRIGL